MSDVCGAKGKAPGRRDVVTVGPTDDLLTAGRRMGEHGIGCLVVTDAAGKMVGILSERDLVVRVLVDRAVPSKVLVEEVMTRQVQSVPPGTPIHAVEQIMRAHRIRHVPVVADGVPVGMISAREVLEYNRHRDAAMREAAEQVARMFSSLHSLNLEEVVDLIARETPHVLGAARSVLFLREDGRGRGRQVHRCGCPCTDRELRRRAESPRLLEASAPAYWEVPEVCMAFGIGSDAVTVPLDRASRAGTGGEAPDGADYLCMCDFGGGQDIQRDLLAYKVSLLATALAANLHSARLFEKYEVARQEALTDGLTGVGTRRFLEDRLHEEAARSARYGTRFTLAIIDVDNFKLVNDRFGHLVGDEVLGRLSQAMRVEKRETDSLGRYGGDEFVVLMPETRLADGDALIERIRSRVRQIVLADGLTLTISAGLAELNAGEAVTAADLFGRADAALAQAKRQGRDRTVGWRAGTHAPPRSAAPAATAP